MALSPNIRALLDALDEPALLMEGRFVGIVNGPARRLFGEQVEGSDIRLAIRHPQVLEHLLEARAGDVEVSGIGGFERPWTLSLRPLEGGALLVRFVDRAPAVAAERMRVDFVANASHELRTPLSTILGYSETLADDADLDRKLRVKFAGVMRAEAKRMIGIIEDLMNLSRIAADRFVPPRESVDLGSLAERVVERIAADGRTIDVKIGGGLPRIPGDQGQLTQLVDNLLTNAIRYGCAKDGDRVGLSLDRDGGNLRLVVSDRGPGIAPEHLPRLTERFYRVDAARSRASGGTGLGLAIVKHIVERHRGTLDIRSTLGEGTEVTVRLPTGD